MNFTNRFFGDSFDDASGIVCWSFKNFGFIRCSFWLQGWILYWIRNSKFKTNFFLVHVSMRFFRSCGVHFIFFFLCCCLWYALYIFLPFRIYHQCHAFSLESVASTDDIQLISKRNEISILKREQWNNSKIKHVREHQR